MNMEIRPLPCPGAQSSSKDTESFIGRKSLSKWSHHQSGCKSAIRHRYLRQNYSLQFKVTYSRVPNK